MTNPILQAEAARQSHDRLGFTLCVGLAFHAVIVLGIAFDFELPGNTAKSSQLEITLAQFKQEKSPETADYLAQYNQDGSGTLSEKRKITTTEIADLNASQIQHVFQHSRRLQSAAQADTPILTSSAESLIKVSKSRPDNKDNHSSQDALKDQEQKQSNEIASLEAELDKMRQSYAKHPRVQRMTSVSTKASSQARYLYEWEQRIEFIGNLHYPEEARNQGIYGDLRLLVAVYPNGSLKEVTLLQSSGHDILDQAALKIIRKAAPFPPFPPELSEQTDLIEIIRTWQFRKDFATTL
jgi:protein TonB